MTPQVILVIVAVTLGGLAAIAQTLSQVLFGS